MIRPVAALLAAALALAGCGQVLPIGPTEVVDEATDEHFTLTVRSPADRYAPGQAIEVTAELVYDGPRKDETIYHAASPIGWRIRQVDGPAEMGGAMAEPCLRTNVTRGVTNRYAFQKGGGVGEAGPFDAAWYQEPTLTLPAGRWRVIADMHVYLGDCGRDAHSLQAAIELVVAP